MSTASAFVLAVGLFCVAAVAVVRMVLEHLDRGKGRLVLAAERAATAAGLQAAEAAKHAANARATVEEMQGTLTALSVRLGLRGRPVQGYPGSEPTPQEGPKG